MTTPADHSKTPAPDPKETDAIGHEAAARHDPADDSSVDLGHSVGGDPFNPAVSGSMSGISVVDWASLVAEDAPLLAAEPASFDAPSDVDLLFPGATFSASTLEAKEEAMPPVAAEPIHAAEQTLHARPEELARVVAEPPASVEPPISFSTEEPSFPPSADESLPVSETVAQPEPVSEEDGAIVFEEATAVTDSAVLSFLADTAEPPPAPAEEAAVAFEPETVSTSDSAVHALLAELPEVPAAPVEPLSGTNVEMVEFVPEEKATISDSAVHALLAEAPEVPEVPEAPLSGTNVEMVEFVPEAEATISDSAVHALLAEAPELPSAPLSGTNVEMVEFVPEEEATISDSAVHALLAEAPDLPSAPPSGPITAEVAFAEAEAESAIPESHPVEIMTTDTPPPISEMALAEQVAFAAPEEILDEKDFTPEAMFAEPEPTSPSGRKLPPAPKMELDSGRNLADVVELGADSIVRDASSARLEPIVAEIVDDEAVIAEVADVEEVAEIAEVANEEEEVAEVAEIDDVAEIVEVEDLATVAEVADEEVLEVGDEALAADSAINLSEVVPEVVETEFAVPPPVPESEIVVAEHESGLDLGSVTDTGSQPPSSGKVALEADVMEIGASGRDLIAEAVESGIDGTLQLPAMDVVDSEVSIASDRKPPAPAEPRVRDKEATREIEIPVTQPEPDDFFSPVESAVVSEDGAVILGAEAAVNQATADESSSIDLGSMPEMPILPSASKAGSEVADIDLAALEQAASASQRGAGKANSEGEIDLGPPSSMADFASISATASASPVVVDEAEIDFSTLEEAAGSAARGGSTVAFGEVVESEPTADLDDEVVAEGVVEEGEEATVAEDEFEGEVVEPEVEEPPAKPKKGAKAEKVVAAKGRGGAWIGGTVLGTLAGAGACVGLWLGGVEPPKDWRKALGTDKTPVVLANANKANPGSGASTPEDLMARGDYTNAKKALDAAPDNPNKQFLLGQLEFREHAVAQARAAGNDDPKLSTEDKPVKSAIEKLEAVKTPEAYFQLGQIYELSGAADKAKESYQAGLAMSKDEAAKKRFQSALDRLELPKLTALPRHGGPLDARVAMLTLLLFAPDEAGAPPDEEAGYAFFRAIKALNAKDYDKALEELKTAEKHHKRGRLLRIGQQQNPDSDPTEEIFLRCVKELRTYWELEQKYKSSDIAAAAAKEATQALATKLKDAKVIANAEDLDKGVDALLKLREDLATKLDVKDGDLDPLLKERAALLDVAKKVGAEKADATKVAPDKLDEVKTKVAESVADAELVKKIGDKLKTDAVIAKFDKRDDVETGINTLVTEWKTIPALNAKLKATETDLKTARAFVDDLYDTLAKADFLNKDMAKPAPGIVLNAAKNIVDMAKGDEAKKRIIRENVDLTMKTGEQAKQLVDLDKRRLTELADQDKKNKAEIATLNATHETAVATLNTAHKKEVDGLTMKLSQSRTPEQMLALWLPLLENRNNKEFVKAAQTDAERVLAAADKKKDDDAKARLLQGLALRNLGQYAEAEAKLKEAEKDLPRDDVWTTALAEALLESKDAVGYFGKKATDLAEHNYPEKAIQLLDRMIAAATPEQKGRLLAERSQLHLEIAMAGGRAIEMTDDQVKQALADATAAGEVAAAHYALGRIREELKDMDAALAEYTKAVNLHKLKDADASRYEAARARTLIAPRTGPRRAAVPTPANVNVGRLERTDDETDAVALVPAEEQRLQMVLLTVMLQPPPVPDGAAGNEQQQADQLADKILADPQAPWDARAEALLIKGRYTDALRTYAEGLQKKRLLRAQQAETLMKLINQHPRLRLKANTTSNPLEAESQFGSGLRMYYAGQYGEAEKHFAAAVDAVDGDDEDARYYYFLGLAQMAQGRPKDATQNIADGAALERRGKPSRVAINASLERVQGELRRVLDDERKRVPTP